MQKKVSIILLNYNGLAFNEACINSLLLQSYINFEILFVDNKSQDGSVRVVEDIFSPYIASGKIKIIQNDENYGFAEGNNIAVGCADSKSEYISLLNNDTTLPPDWLEELVKGIESDSNLGLVGSLVLDQGSEANTLDLHFRQKKGGINNYIFETSFKDLSQQEIDSGIFYTTGIGGCALLYKKHLIEKPFPSFYFAYAEDTFLSISILLQGYKLAVCSKSIVNHFGGGSFGRDISVFKAFHGTKNSICNNLILHSRKNYIRLMPVLAIYLLAKVCSGSVVNRAKGLWKALVRCSKNKKLIQLEKQRIKKLQTISDKQLLSQLSSTIFENIYFMPLPGIVTFGLKIANKVCNVYLRLCGIKTRKQH